MRAIILTLAATLSLGAVFSQDNWRDSYKWIDTDEEDMALYGKDYLDLPPDGVHIKTREHWDNSSILYSQNSSIGENPLYDIKSAINNIKDDLLLFGFNESFKILINDIHEIQKKQARGDFFDESFRVDINDNYCKFIINSNQLIIVMREYVKIK